MSSYDDIKPVIGMRLNRGVLEIQTEDQKWRRMQVSGGSSVARRSFKITHGHGGDEVVIPARFDDSNARVYWVESALFGGA